MPALFLASGITPLQKDQLLILSQIEPAIQAFTNDPIRFASKEAFDGWKETTEHIYTVADREERLHGFVWTRKKPLPSKEEKKYIKELDEAERNYYAYTIGMRLYGSFRGQGLGRPVAVTAMSHTLQQTDSPNRGFWATISADNTPALRLADAVDFTKATYPDEKNKIILLSSRKISKGK